MKQKIISNLLDYYYSGQIFAGEISRALEEFFGDQAKEAGFSEIEDDQVMGMFSEWLVYDFKMKNGRTLLEDFCHNNPLGLAEDKLMDYRELLENKYGMYEILQVSWHEGLTVRDLQTKREYWVKEKMGTEQARKVGNHWEMIGGNSTALPMKLGKGMRKYFSEAQDKFTPKETYKLFYKKDSEKKEPVSYGEKDPVKAMESFQRALEKVELDGFIRAETVKKWIENSDREENPAHYLGLICGLLNGEKEYDEENIDELIAAFNDLHNSTPQKQLERKSPNELRAEQKEGVADWKLEMTAMDGAKWIKHQEKAFQYFMKNNPEKAMEYYNKCFESLLAEQTTGREIYRIFANKALAHFQLGDEEEGAALLEMALKLNPNYDFAQITMEKYKKDAFAKIIARGEMISIAKRMKDPNSPLNRWNYEKIKNKWSAGKILRQLKEYGIETDEETFRKEAEKYPSIEDFSEKIFYPSYSGKNEDKDFVWMAAQGLWQRWCANIPSIESLSENIEKFWDTVFDEESKINKERTAKGLGYFEEMAEKISSKFSKRWRKTGQYQSDVFNLSLSLSRLVGTKLEKRALALAKALKEKTGDDYFLMPDVCYGAYYNKNWEEKLEALHKIMPYEYRLYLETAAVFDLQEDNKMEEKCLKEALAVVEKRDRDKVYDLETSASTIYEEYEDVLEQTENFYKEQKDKAGISTVEEIRKKIEARKEELSKSPASENLEESVAKLLDDSFQERFAKDPANRYFHFLQTLGINFSTEELTESFITVASSKGKVGRNDPCPCGSGKKYKKCCGE